MTIDWTISLANIFGEFLTLVGLIGGVFAFMRASGRQNAMTAARDVLADERLLTLGGRMINVETELRELKTVVSTLAVQDIRLNDLARRLDQIDAETERRIDHSNAEMTRRMDAMTDRMDRIQGDLRDIRRDADGA